MGFLFILLFPTLLWAEKPAKTKLPLWICEGYVKGYDETVSPDGDRFKTLKTFKLEDSFENTNTVNARFSVEKEDFSVTFVFNAKGRMKMFDEKMESEGVSMSVSVGGKGFGGDSFQVMDGAVLPKTIGLRTDLEYDNKNYYVRLICKRNKK
jgi:hypothetical protein